MPPNPDLSVVLATAHPGAALDALLARLLPQLAEVRGELVLVDGSDAGLATPAHPGVAIQHLRRPGSDVFAMRAEGTAAATGWVVAFAEDHCMPADDGWAKAVLAAHVAHGETAAVTGAVANGTRTTAWDRGSFLVTFATVLDPLPLARSTRRVPPPANVSVKREVLASHPSTPGFIEFELMPHLNAVGHIASAPGARMEHFQAHTARWFVVHHFHNGRTTGGLVRRDGGWRTAARQVADGIRLVPTHVIETAREIARRPVRGTGHRSALPVVAVLLCAHVAGQITGVAFGPGRSPAALE